MNSVPFYACVLRIIRNINAIWRCLHSFFLSCQIEALSAGLISCIFLFISRIQSYTIMVAHFNDSLQRASLPTPPMTSRELMIHPFSQFDAFLQRHHMRPQKPVPTPLSGRNRHLHHRPTSKHCHLHLPLFVRPNLRSNTLQAPHRRPPGHRAKGNQPIVHQQARSLRRRAIRHVINQCERLERQGRGGRGGHDRWRFRRRCSCSSVGGPRVPGFPGECVEAVHEALQRGGEGLVVRVQDGEAMTVRADGCHVNVRTREPLTAIEKGREKQS